MSIKNKFNLFAACLLLNVTGQVSADDIAAWSLPDTQQPDEEFLLYRLSFSGFLTAYIWKDIADMVIVADKTSYDFNGKKSCKLNLKMSTEDFLVSEVFSPMRYHWRSTLKPDLKQLFLMEEINENEDDVHEVVWLNKDKSRVGIYHKRKKIILDDTAEALAGDDYLDVEKIMVWEKDVGRKAPNFLVDKPNLEDGLKYLVHDKTFAFNSSLRIYDPLTLIYSARWHDYSAMKTYDYVISHEDSFRNYQVYSEADESLNIAGKAIDSIKVVIKRHPDEARDNEGYMMMWLSDDERRIPLQYQVEAKFGTIKIGINAANLESYQMPVSCINNGMEPVVSSSQK